MDWQQKFAALKAIGPCSLVMRKPGDWYVSQRGVEIKDRGILGGSYGNGDTPQDAVLNHWTVLVDEIAQTKKYLVLNAYDGDKRRAVRWNGFMWADISEGT